MLVRDRSERRGDLSLQFTVNLDDMVMGFASLIVSERVRFADALPRVGRRGDRFLTRHRT